MNTIVLILVEIVVFAMLSAGLKKIRNFQFYYSVLEHSKYPLYNYISFKEKIAYFITRIIRDIPSFSFAPSDYDYWKLEKEKDKKCTRAEKTIIKISLCGLYIRGVIGNVLCDLIIIVSFLFSKGYIKLSVLSSNIYGLVRYIFTSENAEAALKIVKYVQDNVNAILVTMIVLILLYVGILKRKKRKYSIEAIWAEEEADRVRSVAKTQKELEDTLLKFRDVISKNISIIEEKIRFYTDAPSIKTEDMIECQEWKYQNKIYFLKYYPEKEIAETFETSYKTNLLVWDFTQNCSEVLKKQIFYTLSRIIANTSMSKAYRNVRLKSLKLLYDSCVQLNITDIGLLEMEQVETILKNFPETSQRSILGECRRDAFMQQEQIQWEANLWYLERLHLGKHRIDESKSLISISFMEVKEIQNREILQAYMKYELGITGQAVSTIVRRFVCIRNFIELLEQEKILAIHATVAEVKKYADGLRERGIQAKGFNERIFGIGHFYKFMEVKQYITRMPFRIEYFQQKEVVVHHDRSVEETVYMEILKKLYLFPERLRCMFLHLWCLGLRASEVCTLKGNAYYQQGEDYWIQVYQVKMKNYKRIPIPQALYQIMKVYLKKHEIQPEEFIFKNSRGGACLYGTFRTQMIEACRENKIANGEYLFQSHDYRHTVATMFYDSHVSLQSIRDYLGHTYEEMTRQYIDYMPQRIAKANDEFFEMQGSSLASWLKKEEKDGK